jgi:hypothetical protein
MKGNEMKKTNIAEVCRIMAVAIGAVVLLAGPCGGAKEKKSDESLSLPSQEPAYMRKDFAPLIRLTRDTLDAIAAGNTNDIVTKITALKTAWDDAEYKLQPKDVAIWTQLNETLDDAVAALRDRKTKLPVNIRKGKSALEDLLQMFREATKS